MSTREAIARLYLIINRLRTQQSSFKEIYEYLEFESDLQGYDYTISKRTFQRDIDDIRALYDLDIQYNSSCRKYYIAEENQSYGSDRKLEAFDIFNIFKVSDQLGEYIQFEKRKPQGTENLFGIIQAIKNKRKIEFTYNKFNQNEESSRLIEPYIVKEFRNRWYVFGKDNADCEVKNFALDRISTLAITDKEFKKSDTLNIDEYFRNSFGIYIPEDKIIYEVILSFDPLQGKYIKSLPLHESQKVLIDNESEFRIKLNIYLTYDFCMEILSFGDRVKVISPNELTKQIKEILFGAWDLYENS